MPDETGKLNDAEKQKVIDWINERQKGEVVCSICHNTSWFIADNMVVPITIGGNLRMMISGGNTYPQVMLVCNNCSHTIFMNAVSIGVFPTGKIESKPDDR